VWTTSQFRVRKSWLGSRTAPCCGQLEYTKLCVPSILKHTRSSYELIFLDIGSLDGTVEYLAGLKAGLDVRVEIIRTPTDKGIKAAVTEAMARTRGEYLLLLNNDTVVTENWLNQLVSLASLAPAIGLVGPMSNYAAEPQQVETVPYRMGPKRTPQSGPHSVMVAGEPLVDTNAVNAFAKNWCEEHRGKWVDAERLGGFCLLIKREVLAKIGPLEQWSDLSLFDTDILSAKARQAGYTLACCRDLFVHHFGTRTFAHGPPATADHPGR
jgi:GT2 family glycosyltransferase